MRKRFSCLGAIALLTVGMLNTEQASAAAITFTGTVANLCVLTISTPGLLGLAPSGTQLGSQNTGGAAAVLTIVAAGTSPAISFTAPSISGPSASTASAVTKLQYASTGGANQTYSSSAYTYTMSGLLDAVTINAQSTNTSGFVAGTYTISSTATCQQ